MNKISKSYIKQIQRDLEHINKLLNKIVQQHRSLLKFLYDLCLLDNRVT